MPKATRISSSLAGMYLETLVMTETMMARVWSAIPAVGRITARIPSGLKLIRPPPSVRAMTCENMPKRKNH